ncbi:hypothetical protein Ndes2526B_g01469 [Nannochloris sp. 'desiccata']
MLATGRIALRRTTEGSSISSRGAPYHNGLCKLPSLRQFRQNVGMRCSAAQPKKLAKRLEIVATYPEPETEKERSPIDFPQEWITPQPSRRPDIFPEFERLDTPMPKPLPGDPALPDEEEEEEEQKKKKNPDDPEKEEEGEPKPDEPAPAQE